MTNSQPMPQLQLNTIDKTLTAASWVVTGALFLTVGWIAMAPDDPQGVVSMFARKSSMVMLLQAALVAAVAAATATAMAGRRLADTGTFAVAIGLAIVSLQGAPAGSLSTLHGGVPGTSQRALAALFAVETLAWLIVVMVAVTVSGLVMRLLYTESRGITAKGSPLDTFAARTIAAGDLPLFGTKLYGTPPDERTATYDGLRHMAMAGGGIVLFLSLFTAGMNERSAQHGQALFIVAAGVCVAVYVAHRITPVRSALWSILAVPIAGVATYAWAFVQPVGAGAVPNVAGTPFLRILPIQFVSAGSAAAIAMFWWMYKPTAAPPDSDTQHAP